MLAPTPTVISIAVFSLFILISLLYLLIMEAKIMTNTVIAISPGTLTDLRQQQLYYIRRTLKKDSQNASSFSVYYYFTNYNKLV